MCCRCCSTAAQPLLTIDYSQADPNPCGPSQHPRWLGFCFAATQVNIKMWDLLEDHIWLYVYHLQTSINPLSFSFLMVACMPASVNSCSQANCSLVAHTEVIENTFVPLVASWDSGDITSKYMRNHFTSLDSVKDFFFCARNLSQCGQMLQGTRYVP